MDSTVQWSDLPQELLGMISQRLKSRIDVLRFRSVCKSWRRSFIPPFYNISPPSSLKFPLPVLPNRSINQIRRGYFTVRESTLYCLEPSLEIPNPSSSSSSKGWLVRVKEEEPNQMRLLSPLGDFQIQPLPQTFPKVLNLSDFRISELCKAYSPRGFIFSGGGLPLCINKVAGLSSNAVRIPTDNNAFMVIYSRGRLGFLKWGEEEWTAIDEQHYDYSDVINYKGKFYAVNKTGRAIVVDPFLKVTEIASPICDGGGQRKHLVGSLGNLLLVDRYQHLLHRTAVQFKVYKLNVEEHNWVEVRNLGDQVLFVGDDCSFSASAQDFAGCKGNCIYYADIGFRAYNPGVFDLEDYSLRPLASCPGYSDIFWPPATLLEPYQLSYVC